MGVSAKASALTFLVFIMTTVVNINRKSCDVYIGRPSKWGNPFMEGLHGTRKQVIQKYEEWILTQPQLLAALLELKDKKLGCFCKPKACHGDILARLADVSY